jgi:hypothetical protein
VTKTAFLLTLIVTALASIPAPAQPLRVFVSGLGSDSNPCTEAQPCRTFQKAHDTAAANGEIQVLDPAGYGALTISKGISIQGHGFGAIAQTCGNCAAITVSVTTSDQVSLNGLLIDGAGKGQIGISFLSGPSVQILNSVIRNFSYAGIYDVTSTNGSNLLVEDTVASDNATYGINVCPGEGVQAVTHKATLNRFTANSNQYGVQVACDGGSTTIANSVLSNNTIAGLWSRPNGLTFLAKSVISGNQTGVLFSGAGVFGTVNSYGDNYIRDNTTPVNGSSLTPVTMQ